PTSGRQTTPSGAAPRSPSATASPASTSPSAKAGCCGRCTAGGSKPPRRPAASRCGSQPARSVARNPRATPPSSPPSLSPHARRGHRSGARDEYYALLDEARAALGLRRGALRDDERRIQTRTEPRAGRQLAELEPDAGVALAEVVGQRRDRRCRQPERDARAD